MFSLDLTTVSLIASAVSYLIYNLLFLIAQLWEAFATLFLGLYYVLILFGIKQKRKSFLIIGTSLQALTTIVLICLFVFFIIEIFYTHSLVYRLLVYIKNMEEKRRVKVARDTSIVMAVDTFITAVLHVWALIQCFQKCRAFYDENSSDEAPIEAMAIHTELDDPVIFTLPRLRRTSDSEIIGTFGKSQKIFTDHHSSMPPPCRF